MVKKTEPATEVSYVEKGVIKNFEYFTGNACVGVSIFNKLATVLKYQLIFSYLKNPKQCVRINNTYSNFENIISDISQGSIQLVHFYLTSQLINDLFFFIESSSVHNFADDNTLSAWANTISDLINKLESDSNIAIEWFKMNKMIVNPR